MLFTSVCLLATLTHEDEKNIIRRKENQINQVANNRYNNNKIRTYLANYTNHMKRMWNKPKQ